MRARICSGRAPSGPCCAYYRTEVAIDFDDVTNPVAVGHLLKMLIGLTDVADHGRVVLLGARLKVPASTSFRKGRAAT